MIQSRRKKACTWRHGRPVGDGQRAQGPCDGFDAGQGGGKGGEVGPDRQGGLQAAEIGRLRRFQGAELAEMLGQELGVQQGPAAGSETRDQMDQSDLGGVALLQRLEIKEPGQAGGDPRKNQKDQI